MDHLGQNYLDHFGLVEAKSQYFFEGDRGGTFQRAPHDPRLVAFYLPQFHPIEENDRAWGKGFTEWTNVARARPRFVGHWQPILPRDFGFYDLRLEETLGQQIASARAHGVYAFCFHYFWFSGKRLLERPLQVLMEHPEWEFNFLISWANENWTKRWDGRGEDVIVEQQYREDDPLRFIQDAERVILDPRYVRIDNKPVLLVHRAAELRDPAKYARVWREYFRAEHGTELYLLAALSFDTGDPRRYGFDAAIDHAPLTTSRKYLHSGGRVPAVDVSDQLLDPGFTGQVLDYRSVALDRRHDQVLTFPHFTTVMPSWDNDARRRGGGSTVYFRENPDLYGAWLSAALSRSSPETCAPLVFVNAWNEWAEGAIMEPSLHYGSAVLNRTSEVLALHSANPSNRSAFPLYGIQKTPKADIAVIVHLYYADRWDAIKERLEFINEDRFDLYVTVDGGDPRVIEDIRAFKREANIFTVPNRGRDILPFVHLARRVRDHGYRYVLKLHGKKSIRIRHGDEWFTDLITKLLPSAPMVDRILQSLGDSDGMLGPAGHFQSLRRYLGSSEPQLCQLLGQMYGRRRASTILADTEHYHFFAGTMFWATFPAISPVLDLHLMPEDFESETGQVDGTMAHAVERALGIVPAESGLLLLQSDGGEIESAGTGRTQS